MQGCRYDCPPASNVSVRYDIGFELIYLNERGSLVCITLHPDDFCVVSVYGRSVGMIKVLRDIGPLDGDFGLEVHNGVMRRHCRFDPSQFQRVHHAVMGLGYRNEQTHQVLLTNKDDS